MDNKQVIFELETERDNFQGIADEAQKQASALTISIDILRKKWGLLQINNGQVRLINKIDLPLKIEGFPFKGRQIDKVFFVINEAHRFLTKKEVVNRVNLITGKTDFEINLGNEIKKPEYSEFGIIKIQLGKSFNNTVYGLKKWTNEDGKIKAEYKYRAEALQYKLSSKEEIKSIEQMKEGHPRLDSL